MTLKSTVTTALAFAAFTVSSSAQNTPAAPPPPPAPANTLGAPAPPPPPTGANAMAGPAVNENGSIRMVVYGPAGDVQAVVLRNEHIVNVPPDLGNRLQLSLTPGASVRISGPAEQFGKQKQVMAQTIQVDGQTYTSTPPPPPPAPPARPRPGRGPDAAGPGAGAPPPPPPPPAR